MSQLFTNLGSFPKTLQSLILNVNSGERKTLGFRHGQNAFGIENRILGLKANSPFETQVKAYAKFVGSQVKDLGLSANPVDPDEIFSMDLNFGKIAQTQSRGLRT